MFQWNKNNNEMFLWIVTIYIRSKYIFLSDVIYYGSFFFIKKMLNILCYNTINSNIYICVYLIMNLVHKYHIGKYRYNDTIHMYNRLDFELKVILTLWYKIHFLFTLYSMYNFRINGLYEILGSQGTCTLYLSSRIILSLKYLT